MHYIAYNFSQFSISLPIQNNLQYTNYYKSIFLQQKFRNLALLQLYLVYINYSYTALVLTVPGGNTPHFTSSQAQRVLTPFDKTQVQFHRIQQGLFKRSLQSTQNNRELFFNIFSTI